jgi:hypothetical protein
MLAKQQQVQRYFMFCRVLFYFENKNKNKKYQTLSQPVLMLAKQQQLLREMQEDVVCRYKK